MKVACGEYDAFVSLGWRMKFYDLAAAKLIVEKAWWIFEYTTADASICLIKKIIETKDISLLKSVTYKVIASWNKGIHTKIKESLWWTF